MKIGIFDPYLDDLGGGEKYMLSIASCLSKNHDVNFLWDRTEEFKIAEERFLIDLSNIKLAPNIFSSDTGFLERFFKSQNYDAIFFLTDGSLPTLACKKLFVHIQRPIKSLEKLSIKNKIKLLQVTKFFFNSYFTASYLDPLIQSKGVVIYPPVDLYPQDIKKDNIILNVGRLRPRNSSKITDYKKRDVLIEVFKTMVDHGLKNWKLVLAISVNDEDKRVLIKLQQVARGYPIEFLVNSTNVNLWEVYNRAKLYWHASGFREDLKKHPEYAEHFGISTVEAMGGGAVPVVINAGGQKEIVKDGDSGFLWNTQSELIQKTTKLIQNQSLWRKMSQKAKKRAAFFAGDRFCREIEKLIK